MRRPISMAVLGAWCLLLLTVAPAPAQTADALLDNQELHRVDLRLHSADWSKLRENFLENEYYPADLEWNGETVRNIGIRSRGHGSRSGSKPGLRVDFDRYATDQRFLGLKSLVLDNLTQDASAIHETTAMQLMARMGIPAPREAHARLYVNNEYVGLYALIEPIDKRLLARVFGVVEEDTQNDGYLFEFNWIDEWRLEYLGGDLGPYKDRFSAKTRESRSDEDKYRPLEELVRLINETREERLAEVVGPRLDLPAFIRFVATQNFLGETDGVLGKWGLNNFYLYRLENQAQHVFIAWDADVTFWGPTFPINTGIDENVLMGKLIRVPEFRDLYHAELRRAMELANEPVEGGAWLDVEIRRQLALIDGALREDPVKPYSDNAHEDARVRMEAFTRDRTAYVQCELERGPRSGCESVVAGGESVRR